MSALSCKPSSYRSDPGVAVCRAAEPPALIADHRLDRRKQLRRGHEADSHTRAAEHSFDDLAMAVAGNDDAIFNGVAANDPAGGNPQVEDRVARGES